MNPNQATANKSYNITGNGKTYIPCPTGRKLVLLKILIGTKGASSNKAVLYDSTEALGTNAEYKKASIDTTASVGSFDVPLVFFNGILVDTNTGTAGDITLIYAETP